MGCCPVLAFAVAHPEMISSMILYWPVGGAKYRINGRKRFADHLAYVDQYGLEKVVYRINGRKRFADHLAYVDQYGLEKVVSLVLAEGKTFNADPRGGPWAAVLRTDRAFAESYPRQEVQKYKSIVSAMSQTLFDRDTSPGAEPEELFKVEIPALIVPGRDASHATSAARYLEECLPKAEYWDVAVADQTEQSVPARLLKFLGNCSDGL
jgi:pimeloyl-ACP methyl ester carboxylesterase